uniref:Uncharacterized protein n=1 Tax=Populus trichocarpa TaxID=3694 RepID=A0A2K1ZDF3_POPTR
MFPDHFRKEFLLFLFLLFLYHKLFSTQCGMKRLLIWFRLETSSIMYFYWSFGTFASSKETGMLHIKRVLLIFSLPHLQLIVGYSWFQFRDTLTSYAKRRLFRD